MTEKYYKTGAASALRILLTAILIFLGGCGGNSGSIPVSPQLVSIAITPAYSNIVVGSTLQMTATGTYSDGSTANLTSAVTWTPDTPLIATINSTGLATGVAAGWSQFTATLGSITASNRLPLTNEVEPNDTMATATPLTPTVTMTGQLKSVTDLDYYQITANGPGAISVAVNATTLGPWQISILDAAGNILSSAICGHCAQTVSAGISAAGTYYVLVQVPTGYSLGTGNYTLNATTP